MDFTYDVVEQECIEIYTMINNASECLNSDKTDHKTEVKITNNDFYIRYRREFSEISFTDWKDKRSTGFTLKWNVVNGVYNGSGSISMFDHGSGSGPTFLFDLFFFTAVTF